MVSSSRKQEKFLLDNGLTLVVREMPDTHLAALQIWVKTGSIHEGEFLGSGISHYLEHMLFEGTQTRSAEEIAQTIRMAGGKINAFTSFEQTVYHVALPAVNLEIGVEVFADSLFNSSFDPETCERERQVIAKEINMGDDDPDRFLYNLFNTVCYLKHPYRHPIIGYESLFKKITRENLLDYWRCKYIPNNMVVVVAGDFQTEWAKDIITKHFGSHPAGRPEVELIPIEPRQISPRLIEKEFPTEIARFMMGFQTADIFHPDLAALDVLALILAKGDSSRLHQQLEEEKKLVHSIFGFSYNSPYTGLFLISAYLKTENLVEAQDAVWEEIRKIQENGVGGEELQKAKNKVVSGQLFQKQTVEGEARNLGVHECVLGDYSFNDRYVGKIGEIRIEDVVRVARTYLKKESLSVAILKPRSGADENKTEPIKAKVLTSPIEKTQLSNGMTLIWKADPRLPLVSVRALFQGGVRLETEENNGIYNLLNQMLLKGTKNRSQKDIASGIENLGGAIDADSGNNTFGMSLSLMKKDLETGLDIFADCLLNPVFSEEKLAMVQENTLSEIRSLEDDLLSLGRIMLDRALFRSHPYRMSLLGTEETVPKITSEDLRSLHQKVVVPSNTTLAVFGDIDPQKIVGLIEKKFSDFHPTIFDFPVIEQEKDEPGVRRDRLVLDKKQTVVLLGFKGPSITSPDRWGLAVLTEILSGLGSRLFLRIRSAMGLAYYVGSFMTLGVELGSYTFYCGTVPEKARVARDALLEEIRKIKEDGVSEEEMKLARENLIGKKMLDRQRLLSQAMEVSMSELYGLGIDFYEKFNSCVNAVTQEEVRRVANSYFIEESYAEVFVGGKVV